MKPNHVAAHRSQRPLRRPLIGRLRVALVAGAVLPAMLLTSAPSYAQTMTSHTRTNSALYYRLGGGRAATMASNSGSLNLKFSLAGNALLSYSCGKLNIGDAYTYYLNQFKQLANTLEAALGAAVLALPLYILQRADPGLYEMITSYWAKAQMTISAALKNCQEMEAQIKRGGDPYQDYVDLAMGEGWKVSSAAGTNVLSGSENAIVGGNTGVNVFPGITRGGQNQPPLRLVHDTVSVGYNVTMNLAPSASKDTTFPASTPLGSTWLTPRAAADWAVSVLGDQEVATCDDSSCGTADNGAGKAVATGQGLKPKYEAAQASVSSTLNTLVNGASGAASYSDLQSISAPGIDITQDVIDALRRLPSGARAASAQRLASEVALSQTIDRALMLRNLLLSGMSAANYEKPVDDARKRVEQLNRYIDDLLFETRVRKEVVSTTAQLLIESDRATAAARTTGVAPGQDPSTKPLSNGATQ